MQNKQVLVFHEKDFDYLYHISIGKLQKMKATFISDKMNSAQQQLLPQ